MRRIFNKNVAAHRTHSFKAHPEAALACAKAFGVRREVAIMGHTDCLGVPRIPLVFYSAVHPPSTLIVVPVI